MKNQERKAIEIWDEVPIFHFLFPISSKICVMIARIGNSSNGPITNVNGIRGWSGNAVMAMAKELVSS